jgi:hypothetical protein
VSTAETSRRPDLLEVAVDDERLVVDPVAGAAYLLNASAAEIWDLTIVDRDARRIARELGSRHHVTADAIIDDVRSTLAYFDHLGLHGPAPEQHRRQAVVAPHRQRRPGWLALGHRFSATSNDPAVTDALHHDLRRLPTTDVVDYRYELMRRGDDRWEVIGNHTVVAEVDSPAEALATFQVHLRRECVEDTEGLVVLHAAGVCEQRSVVALPAPSGSGKSTLVAGLVRRGHRYVTDEAVAVEIGSRQVRPLPLPIVLDPGSWPLFADAEPRLPLRRPTPVSWSWRIGPDDLLGAGEDDRAPAGGLAAVDDLDGAELALCVFHRYQEGASTTLERLDRRQALVAAVESTFALAAGGQPTLDALAALMADVPSYRLVHGDLDAAVQAVESLLSPWSTPDRPAP